MLATSLSPFFQAALLPDLSLVKLQTFILCMESNLLNTTRVSTVIFPRLMVLGVESNLLPSSVVSTVIYLMLMVLGVEISLLITTGVSTVILLI